MALPLKAVTSQANPDQDTSHELTPEQRLFLGIVEQAIADVMYPHKDGGAENSPSTIDAYRFLKSQDCITYLRLAGIQQPVAFRNKIVKKAVFAAANDEVYPSNDDHY
jgi:hypothetical protein